MIHVGARARLLPDKELYVRGVSTYSTPSRTPLFVNALASLESQKLVARLPYNLEPLAPPSWSGLLVKVSLNVISL